MGIVPKDFAIGQNPFKNDKNKITYTKLPIRYEKIIGVS
jgi:hypothetical protein